MLSFLYTSSVWSIMLTFRYVYFPEMDIISIFDPHFLRYLEENNTSNYEYTGYMP